jgi:hypothetical protein
MRRLLWDHTNVSNGHATATEAPKRILRQSPITSPAQRNTPPITANTRTPRIARVAAAGAANV